MTYDKELYAQHLSRMVQYPTRSNPDPDTMDFDVFRQFQTYLEEAYPLVHKTMNKEIIGKGALLYSWKGDGSSGKKPLVMTAHQDVVPEGDPSSWIYPPYSGAIAEGLVWGRGSTDSKCNIQAYMDALELLIADGFKPSYDLYFAFGYNEEIMGGKGPAAMIMAEEFKKRGIEIGCMVDECGGININTKGEYTAEIIVSEKGYLDLEFFLTDDGGHSSAPGKHTGLGRLCRAMCALEDNPMPIRYTEVVGRQLQARAPFMTDSTLAALCAEGVEKNWDKIVPIMESNKSMEPFLRTTIALTMAKGSEQANILPERSSMTANVRTLPGDSIQDVIDHCRSVLPEEVGIRVIKGTEAPPVQSADSYGYKLIESIVKEKYPGITVIPTILFGGTDSRYYCGVCPDNSIYRFTGIVSDDRIKLKGAAHKVNEAMRIDALEDNVDFYVRLFSAYGK